MAATAVTVNHLDHKTALTKPTATACDATNGNAAANAGTLVLELNNTGASAATVTVSFAAKVDGASPAPLSYSIPASGTKLVGGFPVAYYGSVVSFMASANTVTVIAYDV